MRLMVCLHDNPLNGQEFEPLVPLLKERGIQAVLHKRPIKGSKLPPLLQSIHATAKVSGGGPFGLIAYSWGAYLALAYLKQFPENVTSLILLNPRLVADQTKRPDKILLATPLLRTLVLKLRCRSLAADYIRRTFSPDFPSAQIQAGMESFLSQAQVWKGEAVYQDLLREKPLPSDYSGIHIPVKVLFGKQDCVAPIDSQLPILEKLPRLDAVLVPDAGHALPWTHSVLVADTILKCGSSR